MVTCSSRRPRPKKQNEGTSLDTDRQRQRGCQSACATSAAMDSCSVCYSTFALEDPDAVPRKLPCDHVACTQCLRDCFEEASERRDPSEPVSASSLSRSRALAATLTSFLHHQCWFSVAFGLVVQRTLLRCCCWCCACANESRLRQRLFVGEMGFVPLVRPADSKKLQLGFPRPAFQELLCFCC